MGTTYRMPILQSRREYFRLPYPVSTGAVLILEGTNYKVDELSERGLRVVTGTGQFAANSRIEGTLALTAGVRCKIAGTILRVDAGSFVVQLEKGPTCYDVIREQRHLAKTHPDWKPQPV
ncbi:MAG TPA: PilZ domain-containing protein [Steroidobacteraceae bacterium]|nr:PilZ domain-containing protein [Steroidobacteraceae bacterium]